MNKLDHKSTIKPESWSEGISLFLFLFLIVVGVVGDCGFGLLDCGIGSGEVDLQHIRLKGLSPTFCQSIWAECRNHVVAILEVSDDCCRWHIQATVPPLKVTKSFSPWKGHAKRQLDLQMWIRSTSKIEENKSLVKNSMTEISKVFPFYYVSNVNKIYPQTCILFAIMTFESWNTSCPKHRIGHWIACFQFGLELKFFQ